MQEVAKPHLADRIHVLLDKELGRLEALQGDGGLTDEDLKRLTAITQTYVRIEALRPAAANPADDASVEDLAALIGTVEQRRGLV